MALHPCFPGPVCAVVSEESARKAVAVMRRACRLADVVEVRLDVIRSGDISALLRPFRRPIILTPRGRREGGRFAGSEDERLRLVARLLEESPHWVDIEAAVPLRSLRRFLETGRVILSHHDFRHTPPDLGGRLGRLRRIAGRAPVKLVTMARDVGDALAVRRALENATGPTILFAMGVPGFVTRILGPSWGSLLTYGAAAAGRASAPGQPTLADLVHLYRVRDLGPRTRLYAVAGGDVGRSLSPVIHNTLFAMRRADAVYVPVEGDRLMPIVRALEGLGLRGLSVTAPFKEEAAALAASRSHVVRSVGAANTLVRIAGAWRAYNTDVDGFLKAISMRLHRRASAAVVIGTGGAARACVYGLSRLRLQVVVLGRKAARAERVAAIAPNVRALALQDPAVERLAADLWVNATSARGSPLPPGFFRRRSRRGLAFDHAYRTALPPFLAEARAAGLGVENGLRMLLEQGLLQARLFLRRPMSRVEARTVTLRLRKRALIEYD